MERAKPHSGANWRQKYGFTLIEILIVISIIAVLAGMTVAAVQFAIQRSDEAVVKATIAQLSLSLGHYVQDEGGYPGMELEPDPERNDFPLLFEALCGRKKPHGPGGRNAPYINFREELIAVLDEDSGEYRKATRQERLAPHRKKYLLDPWGRTYVYRANKGKDRLKYPWMVNEAADIYSLGEDGEDQTSLGEESGDIGNW